MKIFYKNTVALFIMFFSITLVLAQENYPKPPKTDHSLFYIQHSNNHNTYVYEANMQGKNFNKDNPIEQYRIVYTEGGVKKPLTEIQKKMAYGVKYKYLSQNKYELYLVVAKDVKLHLELNDRGLPIIFTTINHNKIYLNRMFVKIKEGTFGLKPVVEYVVFEGKDYNTGKEIKLTKKIN